MNPFDLPVGRIEDLVEKHGSPLYIVSRDKLLENYRRLDRCLPAVTLFYAVKTNQHIVIWDLVPEELRYWRANELNFLQVVSDAIRAADPQSRPVMMYEPNHSAISRLVNTVPHQDICGKGSYISSTSEFRHNRIWARWSMEQELGAIAAANTNAVPWILLWMAADALDGEESLIERSEEHTSELQSR